MKNLLKSKRLWIMIGVVFACIIAVVPKLIIPSMVAISADGIVLWALAKIQNRLKKGEKESSAEKCGKIISVIAHPVTRACEFTVGLLLSLALLGGWKNFQAVYAGLAAVIVALVTAVKLVKVKRNKN